MDNTYGFDSLEQFKAAADQAWVPQETPVDVRPLHNIPDDVAVNDVTKPGYYRGFAIPPALKETE